MPATRKSRQDTDFVPEARRDEIIAIIAAVLPRLIQPDNVRADSLADAPAALRAANLPDSAEIRLELSAGTRLSVSAG